MISRSITCVAFLFLFALASLGADGPYVLPIRVTNYADGESVRHPVPLIKGEIAEGATIHIINLSSTRSEREMAGLVHKGRFKVLCELVPGVNRLEIKAGKAKAVLSLNYVPQTNPYAVRVVYMTDNTGNTEYQTPLKNDPQNYRDKLDTAMKLMQTFTAERMSELGFGRRTFNLELDNDGKVKVHLFKSDKPAGQFYKLNDQVWYRQVANEIEKTQPTGMLKNIVIAAYTRFDPKTGKMLGHTALGGGGQGLFGSGNLFTWPSKISDIQPAFMNTTRINPKEVMSDSAFRHTFWAAASTTIGATLHEMGHTFGLPHTNDRMDIMTRGFDHFNRVFTFVDPESATNKQPIQFADKDMAAFAPISAASLMTSPWFALDTPPAAGPNEIKVTFDANEQKIVATSPIGIRYIGGRKSGDMVHFSAPPALQPAPTSYAVAIESYRKAIGDDGTLVIFDSARHKAEVKLGQLTKMK